MDLDGDTKMENVILPDEKPWWAWTLMMYKVSSQEPYKKPYMYGNNNINRWGTYKDIAPTKR